MMSLGNTLFHEIPIFILFYLVVHEVNWQNHIEKRSINVPH